MGRVSFDDLPDLLTEVCNRLGRIEEMLNDKGSLSCNGDVMLSIEEASELINLAESTIYGKVSKREIPVHKKGKKLYFFKSDLVDWIKKGKMKTAEEIKEEAGHFFKTKRL